MIETNELSKEFDGHAAVDRLTMTVEEGEVFGFLGPNGAGKTTTVRMLTSLIAPTYGSASVLNYQVGKDDQEIRQHVGILTETPGSRGCNARAGTLAARTTRASASGSVDGL